MSEDQHYNPLPQALLRPYTGGHTATKDGYVWELCPDHPKAERFGFVAQHRLVVERSLGRFLLDEEMVHHMDENRKNNNIENLQVVSRSDHRKIHCLQNRLRKHGAFDNEEVDRMIRDQGLKKTAKSLGMCTANIRILYPDVVKKYTRKTPQNPHCPELAKKVEILACDGKKSLRMAAEELGVCIATIARCCNFYDIKWVKKSRVGEVHSKYETKIPRYYDHPNIGEAVRLVAADTGLLLIEKAPLLRISSNGFLGLCAKFSVKNQIRARGKRKGIVDAVRPMLKFYGRDCILGAILAQKTMLHSVLDEAHKLLKLFLGHQESLIHLRRGRLLGRPAPKKRYIRVC
jgi:hypothetical protein